MPMYFEERGNKDAPTIVFIHGGGVSGWMWQKQWEAFGDYHVLVPDLPDHGKSTGEGQISIEDGADRIATLIMEHANGGKAHVVGHSLGGKIIVQLLATHPELVCRAVVASALFRPIPLLSITMNMPSYKLAVWMMKSRRILDMQAAQFNFPNDFYREHFIADTSLQTANTLDRIYTQLNRHLVLPSGLEKAITPTLVIAGEKEPKAMRLSVSDVAGALPGAKACLIRGAIHNYPWVQHEAFNDAIRAWLEGRDIINPAFRTIS
jgi:pimeloyl-ACP methyl ester carboxylesterase